MDEERITELVQLAEYYELRATYEHCAASARTSRMLYEMAGVTVPVYWVLVS